MAYNKKAHLQTNIEAIRIAFELDKENRRATEAERAILQQYSGFGGLKCILNPAQSEADKAYWTKSEMDLFPMVSDLHRLIRENSKDENEYKRYFGSLKSSILTAFYTPPEIIKTLSDTLKDSGITPVRFLEPSAGNGAFADAFKQTFPDNETVCFEKDLLTGKILSHLHLADKVHVRGFEEIENRPDNCFDMIASNIPFGDTAVFDVSFSKSSDAAKRQATRAVHNYFFLKGVETLREGGLLAYITSQGVMNSPGNEPVREWLMKNANLVSAVRLPNNLMSDNAGTEVGSDLIILQKNSVKTTLTAEEQAFIKIRTLSNGITINNHFQDFSRVVHTKGYPDKDLYGRPGMIFIHEKGVPGMANDLKNMLSDDFSRRLDRELYRKNSVSIQSKAQVIAPNEVVKPQQTQPVTPKVEQQPLLNLYDLFGFSAEERKQLNKPKKGKKKSVSIQGKPVQLNMFSQPAQPAQHTATILQAKPIESPTTEEIGIPKQYGEIKAKHPNTLLLLRTGDNYTVFGKDASIVSRILGTPLTKRNGSEETGFPANALDVNLPLLVRAGQRVAISEASETPKIENKPEIADMTVPRPYSGILQEHHKQGSLVVEQNGQTGYLQERYRNDAVFKPVELNPIQTAKAEKYIKIRDAYHTLYNYEATELKENAELRKNLNEHYDAFVKRHGNLNDRKNLDLIKMDAGGREMLSLERAVAGKFVKADIFNQPVAFNPNEITQADNSIEALSASLNKFGEVNTEYMLSLIPEKGAEEMLHDLHGHVYYNPLIENYEVSDKFIAGNVIEKAETVEKYLENHPQDENRQAIAESLKALQDATPRPITFEELDFNFGERWIPAGIYSQYATHLFDVDTNVHYSSIRDEYSVKAERRNANIYEKFYVAGEFKSYDGLALMKHALHNTTPNISKSLKTKDSDGKETTVKVRDGEKIQLANSKIDEIRTGFTDWLNLQSPEFKERLTNLYNRTFNCFVRPQYDGSHQTFPGLDLKALGIPDLYQSQKDAVWMLKQNGGGICDHEVLRPYRDI